MEDLVHSLQYSINKEIDCILHDQNRLVTVHEGALVANSEGEFVYSFKAEMRSSIPPESPIYLHVAGQKPVAGTWISQDDFDVMLSVKESIGDRLPRAKVSIDLTFILKALHDRLKDPKNSDVLDQLFSTIPDTVPFDQSILNRSRKNLDALRLMRNKSQDQALANCLGHSLHFVWGPPGTGKTSNLAQTCRALVDQNEKVLVMSHANAAVDVAALRIAKALEDLPILRSGQVLRIGIPQMQEARDCEYISVLGALRRQKPELILALEKAEQERRDLGILLQHSPGSDELRSRLNSARNTIASIRQKVKDAEGALIENARVIVCTVSKFAIDERIWDWKPDTVVLDEVSMLGFPFVYAAAKQAQKRVLLFGDFRQLPPVCISQELDVHEWLGRDAFDIVGVKQAIDQGRADRRVTLLDTQYRMHRDIGTIVSQFSYNGLLRTDEASHKATEMICRVEPAPYKPIAILDTSSLHSACMQERKKGSFSRFNITHALIVLDTCKKMLTTGATKIAVITPYRAQAKLLSQLIKAVNLDTHVTAATIHRFQGAEIDCVVLDLVDALPYDTASRLTGTDPDTATRLLNVAISRSKGKLIIVADVSFIRTFHTGRSPSAKLLQFMHQCPPVMPSYEALEHPDLIWCDNWYSAQVPMFVQVQNLSEADISLPKELSASRQLAAKLSQIKPRPNLDGTGKRGNEPFLLIHSEKTIILGGRHSDSPVAIITGPVKEAVERAIMSDGIITAPRSNRRRQPINGIPNSR